MLKSDLEMCKSDPNPMRFVQIGFEKLFGSQIKSDHDYRIWRKLRIENNLKSSSLTNLDIKTPSEQKVKN